MPLRAIETQRLYQRVAAQIADMIRNGEWASGARLPPERDIARLLGVSRPTVREAMLALELAGLVEVRTGAGTYVRRWIGVSNPPLPQNDAGPSPFDILAARRLVEGEIAALAATRTTAAAAAAIEASIHRIERDLERGTHKCVGEDNGDYLFHTRVAAAAGNPVLEGIIRNLWDYMRSPLYTRFSDRMDLPTTGGSTVRQHRAILERLVVGDSEGARAAMHAHLDHVTQFLLRDD